jgi:hypothetical protein
VTIRADEVRFRSRDVGWAVGGAALLGAFLGAMVIVIPTIVADVTGTSTTSYLLGLFILFAIPIGAIIGLGAAAGAAIAYGIARSAKTRRVATFAVLMALGAGLGAAIGTFVFLALGDNGAHYEFVHPSLWLPATTALFGGGSLPTALIVPLAFRGRARHPVETPTAAPPQNAAPAG